LRVRAYNSEQRNLAVQKSRERAIAEFIVLSGKMSLDEITLEKVAQATGVTVRTLLRHFDGKEHLVREAHETILKSVESILVEEEPGSHAFIGRIVRFMEVAGDYVVRFESEAGQYPSLVADLEKGRQMRRMALSRMFDANIQCDEAARERALQALYVVSDVYAWKILRRDYGLSMEDTQSLLLDLTEVVMKHIPLMSKDTGSKQPA
jgi:AcrR family transcriptional regulator